MRAYWIALFTLSCTTLSAPEAPEGAAAYVYDLCAAGEVEPCVDLGTTWESGDAPCVDGRFDVTACVVDDSRTWSNELVKPAEREPLRWGQAVANNGDPWPMEVGIHESRGNTWVIRLGGGGFCDDDILGCLDRGGLAKGIHQPDGSDIEPRKYAGIKRRWVDTPDVQPRVPNDTLNPDFHDAHFVTFTYRSSDLWMGESMERFDTSCLDADCVIPASTCDNPTLPNGLACTGQWYRRGRHNIRAGLEMLIQRYGLDDGNARVLFWGTSAGAWGAQHTAEIVAELLPETAARGDLRVLVDGAWSASWTDRTYRVGDQYSDVRRNDFTAFGSSLVGRLGGTVSRTCWDGQGPLLADQYKCMASSKNHFWNTRPVTRGGLGLPVYVQKSQLDHIELSFHMDRHHMSLAEDTTGVLDDWIDAQARSVSRVEWLYSCPRVGHTTMGQAGWWEPNPATGWEGLARHVGDWWNSAPGAPATAPPDCLPPQCTVDADCGTSTNAVFRACINEMCVERACVEDAECDDGDASTLNLCRNQRCRVY